MIAWNMDGLIFPQRDGFGLGWQWSKDSFSLLLGQLCHHKWRSKGAGLVQNMKDFPYLRLGHELTFLST